MTTEEKRRLIASVYPTSKSWQKRVYSMDESQVIAIYLSFEKNNIFRTGPKHRKQFERKGKDNVKQLSVFDILGGKK